MIETPVNWDIDDGLMTDTDSRFTHFISAYWRHINHVIISAFPPFQFQPGHMGESTSGQKLLPGGLELIGFCFLIVIWG